MFKKLSLGVMAILLGVTTMWLYAQNNENKANKDTAPEAKPEGAAMQRPKAVISCANVIEMEDGELRRYTGAVVSPSVVHIVPRVSGEIVAVGFKDGRMVHKGQMLYQLDSTQYDATVKSCEAKIIECQAKLNYAQNNYNRNLQLFEKNAVSRDTLENIKSTLEAMRASLLSAEAALISAKDNLKHTTICAPIEGIPGVTNFTQGNYITPNSGNLVTIIQVMPMRVRFSMSVNDFFTFFNVTNFKRGNVSVRLKFTDGKIYHEEGELEFINNEANPRTDAIQIYAKFTNTDYQLITGSTLTVLLSKKEGRHYPAIPQSALLHDAQGSYIYILNDAKNAATKRYVVPGSVVENMQLIQSGVKMGECVVSEGTHKIMPGVEIVVVKGN